jgi:molybdate transport system ATP-binding protein
MSRLRAVVRRRLAGVELDAQLDVGSEIVVLFGPSGAGKTSLLNAIAGLLEPEEGEIEIDGRVVYSRAHGRTRVNEPPRSRRVGFVFQDYALFPHLSALDNVAFPLRRRADRLARARALLAGLGMEHLADIRPEQLSGGQQQRVALARALALDSGVLLLDEPFAALDGALRERLQHDLRRLQQERQLAVIIVTHDLDDAFAIGDRLAVMREGRIEQIGAVGEVFQRPATNGVADVMGIRNVLSARVVAGTPTLVLDWNGVRLELEHSAPELAVGTVVTAYIRPEDVKIIYPDRPVARSVSRNVLGATIVATREAAGHRVLQIRTEHGASLEVRFPRLSYAQLRLVPGEHVSVALRSSGLVILSA